MARAQVYYNGKLAGILEKRAPDHYCFTYEDRYLLDPQLPAISLSLPKTHKDFHSPVLFSFFIGLLSEGVNKDIQCRLLKIDEEDDFTRLIRTAGEDTIGAITVKEMKP